MKTLDKLLETRRWISHIDDEREHGSSIIVTLARGWDFSDDLGCGVKGFDTVAKVKAGTSRSCVTQVKIYL
jgi:hypothetical protein